MKKLMEEAFADCSPEMRGTCVTIIVLVLGVVGLIGGFITLDTILDALFPPCE